MLIFVNVVVVKILDGGVVLVNVLFNLGSLMNSVGGSGGFGGVLSGKFKGGVGVMIMGGGGVLSGFLSSV